MPRGVIFDVQRYSTEDGPGIRTTVFLKGCPLSCTWCHNPEGLSARPEIMQTPSRCIGCGRCLAACPRGVAAPAGQPGLRREECARCGACVAACPTEARQIVGRTVSIEELLEEVLRDRVFYDESGGGVTFSGGEPLMQAPFLVTALQACRESAIHTAVDTSGFGAREDLLAVAERTDLFLFDLKLVDDQRHLAHTGVSNAPILANLRALSERHHAIWIRIPVLPGLNDDRASMAEAAQLLASLPAVGCVSLLPYHAWGLHKRSRLGMDCGPGGLPPLAEGRLEALAGEFRAVGLEARLQGVVT